MAGKCKYNGVEYNVGAFVTGNNGDEWQCLEDPESSDGVGWFKAGGEKEGGDFAKKAGAFLKATSGVGQSTSQGAAEREARLKYLKGK